MNGKDQLKIYRFPRLRFISSNSLSKVITKLSNQALLARVLIPICRDISSLTDIIALIKQNGLKGADSQIDIVIPCSDLNLDSSFHHDLNLSSIDPPSNRMQTIHGVVEVRNQNLYGSESNIDCLHERGSVRSIGIPQSRIVEVWDQNFYGSESNLDCLYEWKRETIDHASE